MFMKVTQKSYDALSEHTFASLLKPELFCTLSQQKKRIVFVVNNFAIF